MISEWHIKIRKSRTSKKAAVCIPTSPSNVCRTPSLASLDQWWHYWKHCLFLKIELPEVSDRSPLFLVTSLLSTPRFAVCFSTTRANETSLQVSADPSVPGVPTNTISIDAAFSISEVGGAFGFDIGEYRTETDKPWVVFIQRLPITVWGPLKTLKRWALSLYQYCPFMICS
jgi:hypothetical protein